MSSFFGNMGLGEDTQIITCVFLWLGGKPLL
jgi:hypothetical protein